ncbi:MAG TPA: response regulator [Rhodocyclaceae bacterium]|nr:response regulator [Rhodocyclaceae bacterium]
MKLAKILYVEDEADIRAVAQLALEMVGGFKLQICSSGAEAISQAEAFAPDLILLDVMMPGMDGPTTLQGLRERSSLANIPAVFMTAKVQPTEIAHFKSLGALDVIAKPFDPMALAGQIKHIWEQRHGGT